MISSKVVGRAVLTAVMLVVLSGCDKAADKQSKTAPAANVQRKTVTLKVDKMTCAACPITVRKALQKVDGVISAKVDFKSKTAVVTFDAAKTNTQALTQVTTNAGYPSKVAE